MKLEARCPPGSVRWSYNRNVIDRSVLDTARTYVVSIKKAGQIVAVRPEKSTGGGVYKGMTPRKAGIVTGASY